VQLPANRDCAIPCRHHTTKLALDIDMAIAIGENLSCQSVKKLHVAEIMGTDAIERLEFMRVRARNERRAVAVSR
jgi:hypothetical protein